MSTLKASVPWAELPVGYKEVLLPSGLGAPTAQALSSSGLCNRPM